ncbi:hypothetical protein [Virgibacillus ihumii]|nr:hypothetical protein [Virgibacillus ihumii]
MKKIIAMGGGIPDAPTVAEVNGIGKPNLDKNKVEDKEKSFVRIGGL